MGPLLMVGEHADSAVEVSSHLRANGYHVDVIAPPDESAFAEIHRYSALLLDACSSGQNVFAVCRRFRHALRFTAPIIVMSDSADLDLKLAAFNEGADDYLVKPVAPAEVELRIRNRILRQRYPEGYSVLRIEDLVLDTATHRVERAGVPLTLTCLEYRMLLLLMRASPRIVTPAEISQELWGDAPPTGSSLRTHLYRLRKQLQCGGQKPLLQTIRGCGYRLVGGAP